MRIVGWVVLAISLASCTNLVDDTVEHAVRAGAQTVGEEQVRTDLESFVLSDEMRHVISQLARDLVASAAGEAREPEVEESLRAIIRTAVEQLRLSTADLPPAAEQAMQQLLVDAEGMVGRVVTRALREVRGMIAGMIHEDEISAWVRGLLRDVLSDLLAMASAALGDDSAERIGAWMRVAFRTLLADVDLEEGTERVARAAARGFGNGLADSLRHELGDVLHQERDDFVEALRDASHDAARPWIVASVAALAAVLVLAFFLWRVQRDHTATVDELKRAAREGKGAQDALHAARARGVRIATRREDDPPVIPPQGPSE